MIIKLYIALFDEPLKYGAPLPLKKQISITLDGLNNVLNILSGMGVKATCIVNPNFQTQLPEIITRLQNEKHSVIISDESPIINYWRSLHIIPAEFMALIAKKDDALTIQAWELSSKIEYNKELRLPFLMRRKVGDKFAKALAITIDKLKNKENGI